MGSVFRGGRGWGSLCWGGAHDPAFPGELAQEGFPTWGLQRGPTAAPPTAAVPHVPRPRLQYNEYLKGFMRATLETERLAATLNAGQAAILATGLTAIMVTAITTAKWVTPSDLLRACGTVWTPVCASKLSAITGTAITTAKCLTGQHSRHTAY